MRNFPNPVVKTSGILQGEIWDGLIWGKQDVPHDGKTT